MSKHNRTGLTLFTAPTFEPITLAQVKDHLRIEHTKDDNHISTVIIPAVRAHVERYLKRALVKQTWVMTLTEFPGMRCPIEVPTPPLLTVDEFAYHDSQGVRRVFTAEEYFIEKDDEGARLFPAVSGSWPDTQEWRPAAVEIKFTCGLMDAANSTKLPPDYRAALLLWAAQLYENREPVVVGSIASSIPYGIEDLLGPSRIVGV